MLLNMLRSCSTATKNFGNINGHPARALLSQAECSSYSGSSNDQVVATLVNRNPRNMEMLRLARKPQGWHLEASSPRYWYKLVLEHSSRHTSGKVVHHNGRTIVSASTQEWAIKQRLYSTADVSAALNIGRVLADRCLQSGITEVYTEMDQQEETSEKVRAFLSALKSGGVVTEEPRFLHERATKMWAPVKAVLPWEVIEEEVLSDMLQDTENPKPA